MKSILTALLFTSALLSGTANASEPDYRNRDWLVMGTIGFTPTDGRGDLVMSLYVTDEDKISAGLMRFSADNCEGFNNPVSDDTIVLTFNGQKVSMKTQCLGKGKELAYPATDEGLRYVHNLFRTSKSPVNIHGNLYSPMGYTAVFNHLVFKNTAL